MSRHGRWLWFVLVLSIGCLGGCGVPQRPVPAAEVHLTGLAHAYGFYQSKHMGQTPPNEEQLKSFLKGLSDEQREGRGIKGDVDKLFVSPRDHAPYVVRYNLKTTGVPGPEPADVIAYEKTGSGGKHYVAYSIGPVEEVDDAQLKKLLARK